MSSSFTKLDSSQCIAVTTIIAVIRNFRLMLLLFLTLICITIARRYSIIRSSCVETSPMNKSIIALTIARRYKCIISCNRRDQGLWTNLAAWHMIQKCSIRCDNLIAHHHCSMHNFALSLVTATLISLCLLLFHVGTVFLHNCRHLLFSRCHTHRCLCIL